MKKQVFLDTECYPNYFLIIFKNNEGKERSYEINNNNPLPVLEINKILENYLTIGFNSRLYDLPMIIYALKGVNNQALKTLSDKIINNGAYNTLCEYNLWAPKHYDHIDLINVAIGKSSLKMYGARINTPFLQDLPFDPSLGLTDEQKIIIKKYCSNDVDITKHLYEHLKKEIDIRTLINKDFDVEVRSKSDAQIADVLINKELLSNPDRNYNFNFKYVPPAFINFNTNTLNDLIEKIKSIEFTGKKGDKLLKKDIPSKIKINETEYSMGIGGLHSIEEARYITADETEYLIDIDVISYYPTIILNNEYSPKIFNKKEFLEFYKKIYEDRILAKLNGNIDKSNVYKIILNGSFGKFGDQFSKLYAPELLIHTTLTGQLSLLMLIERLEEHGYNVVSANTDGLTIKVSKNKYDLFKKIITAWEDKTNFKLEEVKYKALYNQSVNSYIAVKEDNSLKLKGVFADNDLSRNPAIQICKKAIFEYLLHGKNIETTIMTAELNPINFIMVRKVKTGGYWKGDYLGKVVRWYWSKNGEPIRNIKGDKVANTDDAYPLMDLNETMKDICYDKYINKTYELLETLGIK